MDFGLHKILSLKLLLLSLFCMILIAFSGFSPMVLQKVVAQQPSSPAPTSNSWVNNTTSTSANNVHLSTALLNQIKPMVLKNMGNKSKGGVSIVVGVITPNGTSVSGYGNISKVNTTKVNGNTIFDIASITKTFTTALLADMVKRGIVNLDDPLQKYLPRYFFILTLPFAILLHLMKTTWLSESSTRIHHGNGQVSC